MIHRVIAFLMLGVLVFGWVFLSLVIMLVTVCSWIYCFP